MCCIHIVGRVSRRKLNVRDGARTPQLAARPESAACIFRAGWRTNFVDHGADYGPSGRFVLPIYTRNKLRKRSQLLLHQSSIVLELSSALISHAGGKARRLSTTSYMSAVNETDPAAYDANGCLVAPNLFSQTHNVLLQQGIRELRRSYPSATIAYADYFYAYVRMLKDAGKMGFDEGAVTKACCGAGGGAYNFDMDRMCGAPGTSVCASPDERISWDGVHLTQRANSVTSDLLYHKGFASPAPVEFPRST
ncbi:unnamed protein product [Urochloa humidicola]